MKAAIGSAFNGRGAAARDPAKTAARRCRVPALLFMLGLTTTATAAPDDLDIATAIETQYVLDRVVDADLVDVEVTDGLVQLEGQAPNLLARERAERIAEQVRGVRMVANGIEVQPLTPVGDHRLRAAVEAALADYPATEAYEIEVTVKDGRARLAGQVDSLAEKALAERQARRVSGVVDVANDIEVNLAAGRVDGEIQAEIRQRLRANVLVDDALVEVTVQDGAVRLRGLVGSLAEKREAMRSARVPGVSRVDAGRLEVDPDLERPALRGGKYAMQSDEEIVAAIRDALRLDPRVEAPSIDPTVGAGGWVTLRGRVDNLQAKRVAERVARQTVGVIDVTNLIKIRSDFRPTDDEIARQVRERLARNPLTRPEAIEVAVSAGEVALLGAVDSRTVGLEAEREAGTVRGVVDVHNRLLPSGPAARPGRPFAFPGMTPPEPPPAGYRNDTQLEAAVRRQLRWSPFIDATEVAVTVVDGIATLEGRVGSWREYHAAEDQAWRGGVTRVRNRLEVMP